jgi:hypothetical protein
LRAVAEKMEQKANHQDFSDMPELLLSLKAEFTRTQAELAKLLPA